jgi:hypothetical protein
MQTGGQKLVDSRIAEQKSGNWPGFGVQIAMELGGANLIILLSASDGSRRCRSCKPGRAISSYTTDKEAYNSARQSLLCAAPYKSRYEQPE